MFKNSFPLLILFVATAFLFSVVRAQPPKDTSPPGTSTKLSPEEIERVLQTIEDPMIEGDDEAKLEAYEKFGALPLAQRLPLYRRLVASSNDGVARGAIQFLLLHDDVESEPLIEKRMASLPIVVQGYILNAVLPDSVLQPKPIYLRLARQELEHLSTIEIKTGKDDKQIAYTTAGLAALILANARSIEDREAVRIALHRSPSISQLWLALVLMKGIGQEEIRLGQTVFAAAKNNSQYTWNLRADVALALAPSDPNALAFFVKQVQELLRGFGSQPEPTTKQVENYNAEAWEKFQYDSMQTVLIGRLRFLPTKEAQPLIFRALNSPNLMLRRIAALVAANRYPEQLLVWLNETKNIQLSLVERENFMVFIAMRHPTFQQQVRLKLKNYDVIVKRLRSQDVEGAFEGMEAVIGL